MLPDLLIDIYDDALVCRMRIACLSAKTFNCQLDTYKDGKQKKSCRNNKHDEDTIIEKKKRKRKSIRFNEQLYYFLGGLGLHDHFRNL